MNTPEQFPKSLIEIQKAQSSSKFAVLVRVKNEAAALPDFLRRIEMQETSEHPELIFLDSGSTDETIPLLSSVDCTVYQIAPEDFSFGSSCNLLMSLSQAAVCMFLSGHVLLENSNIFNEVYENLRTSEPSALYLRQVPSALFGSTAYERAYLHQRFPRGTRAITLTDPGSFSNAASAINRSAWELTPFPDVAASEDFLWAQHHLLRGGRLQYFPHLCAGHSHRETPEQVYQRVKLNVDAKNLGFSPAKAAKFFAGVFMASMYHGATPFEAARYAISHARAYL